MRSKEEIEFMKDICPKCTYYIECSLEGFSELKLGNIGGRDCCDRAAQEAMNQMGEFISKMFFKHD
jgi:hypothetical protein